MRNDWTVKPRRMPGPLILTALALALLMGSIAALAQGDDRTLTPGSPVEGVLNAENPAQVYTFAANQGDAASVTVTSQAGLGLTVLLTDASGAQIGRAADTEALGLIALQSIRIPADGTYYLTIFPAPGIDTLTEGAFLVALALVSAPSAEATGEVTQVEVTDSPETTAAAEATAAPELSETPAVSGPEAFQLSQVLLPAGMQINLRWNSPDDLNLQVRDPIGESLYWDSRTTTTGGTFGFDVNGLCEVITTENNTETAAWPNNASVSTGSYELLVYYRQACEGNNPVDFTVDITVNGNILDSITGTLQPPVGDVANVFIGSVVLNQDSTSELGLSGPYVDTRILDVPVQDLLNQDAELLEFDVPAVGLITSQQPYQTYQFVGQAGQVVSISMNRLEGNLDTLLLVLNSAGSVIDANDDVEEVVNTNSGLPALRLPSTDTYTIVATRYGKTVGGTEGTFQLVVSGPGAAALPPEVSDLQLPTGDIEVLLTWNTNADLQLLVRDPIGDSVFDDTPSAPSGGRLQLAGNVNCLRATTTIPVSYIYWPDEFLRVGAYEIEVWHQSECGDATPVQFTLTVVVEGQLVFTESRTLQFQERYLANFEILSADGASEAGTGGIIAIGPEPIFQAELAEAVALEQASAVVIADGQSVPGNISRANPFDVYVFEGQAGDVVTIDMRQTSGTLDTLLFLLAPESNAVIAQNDDSNESTNSLISEVLLEEDGLYTIVAAHFGGLYGATSGGYTLSLRIDAP